MTNKHALREAANAANIASWGRWESYKPHKGARGYEVKVGVKAIAQHCLKVDSVFIAAANPSAVLALLDELEAKDKRIAELERGSKVIKCWSCQKSVTVDQVKAEDGYCPFCDCGIDLEEYETEELVAAGIITRIEG